MTVTGKLGNMRKSVEWTIYPQRADGKIFVQSDRRAVLIDPTTKKGMLSKSMGYPTFASVLPLMGASEVPIPDEFLQTCISKQPSSGDSLGGGVCLA